MFIHCRTNLQDTEAVTPGYPPVTSWLPKTTSIARVVGAGRGLLYLVVRHKQQIPSIRIYACARKDEVAEETSSRLPSSAARGQTIISSRQTAREIDTQPSTISDPESDTPAAPLTSDVDQGALQVNPHYGLRSISVSLWNLRVTRLHLFHGLEQVSHYFKLDLQTLQ